MENYALIFPSMQLCVCYHGKLIVNQSHLQEFLENFRQLLIMDKKSRSQIKRRRAKGPRRKAHEPKA